MSIGTSRKTLRLLFGAAVLMISLATARDGDAVDCYRARILAQQCYSQYQACGGFLVPGCADQYAACREASGIDQCQ